MNTKLEDTFDIPTITNADEENNELSRIEQSIQYVDDNKEIVKVNSDTDTRKTRN